MVRKMLSLRDQPEDAGDFGSPDPLTGSSRSVDPTKAEAAPHVVLTGIEMTFESMVNFILKWTLASIVALLILALIAAVIAVVIYFIGLGLGVRA